MAAYAYELYADGVKTSRGIVSESDCESAHDFSLWLANGPLPAPADEIRVWTGTSTAGHPVVVRQRRRNRAVQAVTA